MDDPLLVRRFEGFGDLLGDGESFVDGDRPFRDAIRQGRPLDEFEHQRLRALGLFQPVDVPDVGMVQRGEDFGFPLEAGQAVGVRREGVRKDFQRNIPIQLGVSRLVHLSHTASANAGRDFVRSEPYAGCEWHWAVGESSRL